MSLSINRIGRIFQTYRTQERIADLNRQANLRTVQNPRDRVTISTEARELAETQQNSRTRPKRTRTVAPAAPPPPPPPPTAEPVVETSEPAV